MITTLISLPYEIARLPLAVVNQQLAARLPESSTPRVTLDRALGSVDRVAGTILHNEVIVQRGAARVDRAEKLFRAATLEQEAASRREEARDTVQEAGQEAAHKRQAAQDRAVSGLKEADEAEMRATRDAKKSAADAAASKKAAADKQAARRKAAAQEKKLRVEAAAEQKQKAAEREAEARLGDARETKQSAAESRADAERLEALTETKKQERKDS